MGGCSSLQGFEARDGNTTVAAFTHTSATGSSIAPRAHAPPPFPVAPLVSLVTKAPKIARPRIGNTQAESRSHRSCLMRSESQLYLFVPHHGQYGTRHARHGCRRLGAREHDVGSGRSNLAVPMTGPTGRVGGKRQDQPCPPVPARYLRGSLIRRCQTFSSAHRARRRRAGQRRDRDPSAVRDRTAVE